VSDWLCCRPYPAHDRVNLQSLDPILLENKAPLSVLFSEVYSQSTSSSERRRRRNDDLALSAGIDSRGLEPLGKSGNPCTCLICLQPWRNLIDDNSVTSRGSVRARFIGFRLHIKIFGFDFESLAVNVQSDICEERHIHIR
jgi:hypothetical protein